ncbi:MAG: substrate-binding domain-containing protein [Muribaculaceae bacterium]|nr:substrate-binding domain-containing protein [Muribaculaceae bacterium]
MKNSNILSFILFIFLTAIFSPGCGRGSHKKFRVGVSQCSGDYWRSKINEDIQRELLFHDDVEIEIRSADNDNVRQEADIRYFMDNGFDLIIVSPNEAAPLTPVVSEAFKKGIPVVTFDRRVEGDDFTAHMEVDNYELGKSVAQYACSLIKHPLRVIEIQGKRSTSPAIRRHEGFMDEIQKYPHASVLASPEGNWSDVEAERLTDSLLDIYPETNLIYAHTDFMAIGASKAVDRAGRNDIYIIGIDGFPDDGIRAVKEGRMTASFLYPTEGERILRIAMAILNGEKYERITQVPPLSAVDKTNADIILSQDSLLTSETAKINLLRSQLDEYWNRHSMQTLLLYAVIVIMLLLGGLIFVLLKTVNSNRRHQKTLEQKNTQLETEQEKQKMLYERLEEATRSKLVFFTNVSHDLRTPLTLISGPVEQLAEADYLTPRDKSLMLMARKNVNILGRLINQILDFRKYENGKTDLVLSEVDLPKLIEEWVEAFREMGNKRDIRLVSDICRSGSGMTAVDVEKMERVFFNLMSNAFKHTPDNGVIKVAYSTDGSSVSISVKDNGEGISKEDCGRIFDRFFQADKERPKGSGIGLALTKAFVELHGGMISVDSEKGRGSEFVVTIPVRHCDMKAGSVIPATVTRSDIEAELSFAEDDTEKFDSDKPIILVIDDNRDIRRMIRDLLEDSYNIIHAGDGFQGVRMAVKYVPDLIICDVMMPEMDGMECVRRIKDEVSTSHIPVLMLTACTLDEQRAEGYDNGADGYLSKPFSGSVLAARCRNLLLNRKRISDLYKNGVSHPIAGKDKTRLPQSGIKTPNDVESEFYSGFVKIVTSRLSDTSLNIEEIASEMGLSQSQFTRKIKALTNYTPVEIIRKMRLKKAKTLLAGTEKTVGEIAFEVGFNSLAYFSKCYKEEFGISPSELRGKK